MCMVLFCTGTSRLAIGENVCPFSFSLPYQLPSTLTGEHGCIKYQAKVKVVVPWGLNKVTKRSFDIMSMINLNNDSSLKVSIQCNGNCI